MLIAQLTSGRTSNVKDLRNIRRAVEHIDVLPFHQLGAKWHELRIPYQIGRSEGSTSATMKQCHGPVMDSSYIKVLPGGFAGGKSSAENSTQTQ